MGMDNIPTRSTGQTILDDFFNVLKRVCGVDWVPRNISGLVTANAGQLGTPTYPWNRAHVTTGYFTCGDVKMFHDFNGAVSPGHGWMKCNGDIVSEATYNAIHGLGAWAAFIVASPLDGKYLPDMNNRFAVGATNTTQSGAIATTYEGVTGHQINLQHSHTVNSHNHTIAHTHTGTVGGGSAINSAAAGGTVDIGQPSNANSGSASPGTNNQLSATQSIKPESCAFEFWMRII